MLQTTATLIDRRAIGAAQELTLAAPELYSSDKDLGFALRSRGFSRFL
jgi:hypothetical protein